MILDEYVEITMAGKNCQYYGEKGYPNQYGTQVKVKVQDLAPGSHVCVHVKCDYCGHEDIIKYQSYLKNTANMTRIYTCKKCKNVKYRETCLKKYGFEYATQSKEVQEKTRNTSKRKYGCDHFLQNKEVQNKRAKTNLAKYGVEHAIQLPQSVNNRITRSLELFGADNPFCSPLFQESVKQYNIEHYSGASPMACSEIREKVCQTMSKNQTQKASAQQKYLHHLYGGILNHPLNSYSLDIFLPEHNLDIEYNGGGHDLIVKTGNLTEEEFHQKEIIRGRIVRSQGIRQMTIVSRFDRLPSDDVLQRMLKETLEYLDTTDHHWVKYDIDEQTMENALGISPYDYGELRTKFQLYKELEIIEETS